MKFESISLNDILRQNEERILVLPNFQRSYVWDPKKQKTLLSSFLLGLPIGNLLILKGTNSDFSARKICFEQTVEPEKECRYLLDGQQRISTLKGVFSDLFNSSKKWSETFELLPYHLTYRWFIKIDKQGQDSDDYYDFLGYNDLCFRKEELFNLEPSQLQSAIHHEKILKKNSSKWFHPDYDPLIGGKYLDRPKKRNDISKNAADSGLIPLYEIYSSEEKALHKSVIERIANERATDLKNTVRTKEEKIKILETVEPDIESYINNHDTMQIESSWMKLYLKWSNDVSNFLSQLLVQELAQISLPKDEQNRAFAIFETINKGGTPLSDYDLIVAKAARNTKLESLTKRVIGSLSESIVLANSLTTEVLGKAPKKIKTRNLGLQDKNEPSSILKNQFLNLLSIKSHCIYGKPSEIDINHIKRNKILELTCEQINNNAEDCMKDLRRAIAFLVIRCGISKLSEVPYKLMILPIAYCLSETSVWKDRASLNKIEYWYWSSLFSGSYRENQNSQAKNDIKKLYEWIHQGANNFKNRFNKILEADKYSNLETLNNKLNISDDHATPKAISKGILQYVLSNQPKDFLQGNLRLNSWSIGEEVEFPNQEEKRILKLNDHHIYPLGSAVSISESTSAIRSDQKHILNSSLNRTLISDYANRKIRDKNPTDYLGFIEDTAQYGHSIPVPFKDYYNKDNYSSEQEMYEAVIEKRYIELRRQIKDELCKLYQE